MAVAGESVLLTLNGPVSPFDGTTPFTLSYSRSETGENIRSLTGHEVADINRVVTNARTDRCVNGRVVVENGEGASGNSGGGSGQGKQGKSLTLKFDRPLDTGKALKASAFGLAGRRAHRPRRLFGDCFTGTPNVGFGLSDSARDYRIGWRLTSAIKGDPGFEVNLDAIRKEAANGNEPPEHGMMLRAAIRW